MNYIKQIQKRFSYFNIIMSSIIISLMIYVLDYYNVVSYIFNKYDMVAFCFSIGLLLYAILEIVKNQLWKFVYIETINYFDKLLWIGLVAEILFIFNYFILYTYWKNIIFVIIFINALLLLFRIIKIGNLIKKNVMKEYTIYSLYDLFNNNIKSDRMILLEEKAITSNKQDLLDINLFTDVLEKTVVECSPKDSFVVALTGKWGSGKTSIINAVKERLSEDENIIMETFSPWQYDDKYSLFKGFYNYIFSSFNKNIGYINYKENFNKYKNVIFGILKKETEISIESIITNNYDKDIDSIKDSINDYISFSNKKIVIVIDDIDRLDKEQILFVFKILKTVFDFDNIIYILCYDNDRIKQVFEGELKIDNNYLDKIIQSKMSIPKVDKNVINTIGCTSINNLLSINNINIYDNIRLQKVLSLIFDDFEDLREVIRFINTFSISLNCLKIIDLDVADYISLEYIKYKDIGLYNKISSMSNYLISEDTDYNPEYELIFTDSFNSQAKEKLNELFSDKDEFKELLSIVFPNVEKYKNNQNLRSEYLFSNQQSRNNSVLMKRCSNGRYFNIYFSLKNNFFTKLNYIVEKFIKNVDNSVDFNDEMDKMINIIEQKDYNILLELLNIRIEKIHQHQLLFDYLICNYNKFTDDSGFFGLSAKSRVQILISSIIKGEQDNNKAENYIDELLESDLFLLEGVLYWTGPDKYGNNREHEELFNYGKNKMKEKLNSIIDNNIDIFDINIYERHYCWLFVKNMDDQNVVKQFISSLINKNNIFRILGECVAIWNGTHGRSYEFSESNFNDLIDNADIVNETLKVVDYKLNQEQEKILDLYHNKNEKSYIQGINFDIL